MYFLKRQGSLARSVSFQNAPESSKTTRVLLADPASDPTERALVGKKAPGGMGPPGAVVRPGTIDSVSIFPTTFSKHKHNAGDNLRDFGESVNSKTRSGKGGA